LLIALRVPYHKPAPRPQSQERSALWRNPTVLLLFVSVFCVNIPSYGLMAWLPKFFVQSMGMPLEVSGYIVAAGGGDLALFALYRLAGRQVFPQPRAAGDFGLCADQRRRILGIFHTSTALPPASCCLWGRSS
jgi:hypothetical protein